MMFDTRQPFELGLSIGGMVFGMAGTATLKSRGVECAYTYATAVALRGKDCMMKTTSMPRGNCDDIYEDTKGLNERYYAAGAKRAYQEVKALVEEYEAVAGA